MQKKTRGLMFVLAFFNEEKERIQIEKLTQLSKKCKEKVQKRKKEKRKKNALRFCA